MKYVFARATFSEDAVFYDSWFSTANLVFTVTLSIYHLVFNPTNIGVLRLKLRAGTQMVHHSENFSVNTMKKYFASNLLSQGSNERDYLLKDVKSSVFGMFNRNINLSTEFQYWTA